MALFQMADAPTPEAPPEPTGGTPTIEHVDLSMDQSLASSLPSSFGGGRMPRFQTPRRIPRTIIYAVIALVILVALAVVALNFYRQGGPVTTSTLVTTTINSNGASGVLSPGPVSSCGTITQPGVYYLSEGFAVSLTAGPCIAIYSGNVTFDGRGNNLVGSGPYVVTSPPTFGIYAANLSNVVVENLSVSKFSYDVYFYGMYGSSVENVKALNATVSDIYLSNSSMNILDHDLAYGSQSSNGGIYISGGGQNRLSNSSMQYNAYYGLYLNSTNNTFFKNVFSNNPADLVCSGAANTRKSNSFSSSSCQVNKFCNFASCSTQNLPYEMQNTQLAQAVNSCGSLDNLGVYVVGSGLNLSSYENTSNPLSEQTACITINSPDVTLNCNNQTINNAYYGVLVQGLYNTTVENCNFVNDSYGLYLKNTIGAKVNNIDARGGIYGAYLDGTTGTVLNGVRANDNTFGLYLNGSSASTLYNLNTYNNTYGIYVNGAAGNAYYSGSTAGNSNADLYCSASSYNASQNFFKSLACGSSDCNWASSCTTLLNTPLAQQPVFQCGTFSAAGNYTLKANVINQGGGTCFTVRADNVTLNCNNGFIQGSGEGIGTAFSVQGASNFKLENCIVRQFQYGIYANNANYITLNRLNITFVGEGVHANGTSFGTINNVSVATFSDNGFELSNLNNTVVSNNDASGGLFGATGFVFTRAHNNIITNNTATNINPYGFTFNESRDNRINGNNAQSTGVAGYACDPASSGLFAQKSGVNYGVGKIGCKGILEINSEVPQNCGAIMSASIVQLSQDMLYTFGSTCFTVGSSMNQTVNSTVIDCEGHTVLSNSGGTFLSVGSSAQNFVLQNCYIENFTTAVYSAGTGTQVLNTTIANAKSAIYIDGGSYTKIQNDLVTNSSLGIYLGNANFGSVLQDNITNTLTGLELAGSTVQAISNVKVNHGQIGLYLINSTLNQLQDNFFLNQSRNGALCTTGSGNFSSLNRDNGGNVCSSNSGCLWMSASSPLCQSS